MAAGEKVLAGVVDEDGTVAVGTRDAIYVDGHRVPWETVEKADWSQDDSTLTVVEVGSWGERRPVHTIAVDEPGLFLQLVRERVTASVVLQRHVPVHGRKGVFVIARRRAARGPADHLGLRVRGGRRPRRSRGTAGGRGGARPGPRRGRARLTGPDPRISRPRNDLAILPGLPSDPL